MDTMTAAGLGLIVLAALAAAYTVGRVTGKANDRGRSSSNEERRLARTVHELLGKVEAMNETNTRYLTFMFNVSSIIQRLNMTLSSEEIMSSVERLVKGVIDTDRVELYLFDADENRLRIAKSSGDAGEVSFALGEGLVGMAARDGTVKLRGRDTKSVLTPAGDAHDALLFAAAPIHNRDRLFGAIGIGQIRELAGSEVNLIKVIADIAGIALMNRSLLGHAHREANTDPLTGICNRRSFFQMADFCIERSIKEGSVISVFLFDIDNFKHYNDTNGHDEGDRLLIDLTVAVKSITRKDAVFARYGGEEFIVMLPGIQKEDAMTYAESVREKIAAQSFPCGERQPLGCISISGGVATYPLDEDSFQKVIKLADAALYQAKAAGRNRVLMHEPRYFT
jgi:diguanylate cyclase (GGDEF)-like protein